MFTHNINKILKSINPTIKINKQSKIFLLMFLNKYISVIKKNSSSDKLNDIKDSLKQITPPQIYIKSIKYAEKNLPDNLNTVENSDIFLNYTTLFLCNYMLRLFLKCTLKNNLNIIYSSCIIISMANNTYIKSISNTIDIYIPSVSTSKDKRTIKELISILKKKGYKGIDNFNKKNLLLTKNSKLIKFYLNEYSISDTIIFDDIVDNWSDITIEKNLPCLNWIFPNILSPDDIKILQTNLLIRRQVISATLRLLRFYGYILTSDLNLVQYKPLYRKKQGIIIGLYSVNNYKYITNILTFLNTINMEYLSALVFLVICTSVTNDPKLSKLIIEHDYIKKWIHTQPFLLNIKKPSNSINGLNYTGNSCYMDSSLLSLFAVANKTLTEQILEKNLDIFNDEKHLWFKCPTTNNLKSDIKLRKNIQTAIVTITNSIRNSGNVKNCKILRKAISKCPHHYQRFQDPITNDAGEFIQYLFKLFQVNISTRITKIWGSHNGTKWYKTSKVIDNHSSPIITITDNMLLYLPHENNDLSLFLKHTECITLDKDNKWNTTIQNKKVSFLHKKELIKFTISPILIFTIDRSHFIPPANFDYDLHNVEDYTITLKTNIIPPESIKKYDIDLSLSSIVIHDGGAHYICCFKSKGNWFSYDDNPGGSYLIKNIGTYSDMLKTKPSPVSLGTVYIYT